MRPAFGGLWESQNPFEILKPDTLCTGTIVGPRLVVTAAHCLSEADTTYVLFGDDAVIPKGVIGADRIEIFAGYQPTRLSLLPDLRDIGDVGLIILDENIPVTHRVAKIASKARRLKKTDRLMLVGYGRSEGESRGNSGVLRKTNVNVLMPQFGRSEFVVDQTSGTGACFGDSGGPAFLYENADYYLIGIASRVGNLFFDKCKGLAIYSHAGFYRDFILGAALK